jgi:hypothetical protein
MTRRGLPGAAEAEDAAAALARHDSYWPAQLAVLATILVDLDLPDKLTLHPSWLLPAFEGALLLGLIATTPRQGEQPHRYRRWAAIALVGIVSAVNLLSLVLLTHYLLHTGSVDGRQLILAGVEIWVTNILLFAVWYWELDRGGPQGRKLTGANAPAPDFLFPQMTEERLGRWDWRAGFVDYLYVSFTNVSAFSPTDTMPLSASAKMLMLIQATIAIVTIGLVVARAVNILA